eukprot:TRINITY_DN29039_c0_g1_i1.p1 TRINITY_DN29039_c0_g1~~TRINITY_DN29039_c0_g1_i1.p1  ORF type:complete len:162 (-),score=28.26 TRINITY_DN29039_c0_g1_i1:98-583(-)
MYQCQVFKNLNAFAIMGDFQFYDDKFYNFEIEKLFLCRLEREMSSLNHEQKKNAEKQLLNMIQFLDCEQFFDCLIIKKEELENVSAVIQVLDQISNNQLFSSFSSQQRSGRNGKINHFTPIWFNPKSFQTTWTWIASYLEKNISQKYELIQAGNNLSLIHI